MNQRLNIAVGAHVDTSQVDKELKDAFKQIQKQTVDAINKASPTGGTASALDRYLTGGDDAQRKTDRKLKQILKIYERHLHSVSEAGKKEGAKAGEVMASDIAKGLIKELKKNKHAIQTSLKEVVNAEGIVPTANDISKAIQGSLSGSGAVDKAYAREYQKFQRRQRMELERRMSVARSSTANNRYGELHSTLMDAGGFTRSRATKENVEAAERANQMTSRAITSVYGRRSLLETVFPNRAAQRFLRYFRQIYQVTGDYNAALKEATVQSTSLFGGRFGMISKFLLRATVITRPLIEMVRLTARVAREMYTLGSNAARFADQEVGFRRIATAASIAQGQFASASVSLNRIRQAAGGTIEELDLMRNSTQAALAGISPDKIDDIVASARILASVTGRDASEAFTRLTNAITKQERRLLDELGVVVRAEDLYRDYARAHDLATESMTAEQKQAAFLEGTLAAVSRRVEALGGAVESNQRPFIDFAKAFRNLNLELGQAINQMPWFVNALNLVSSTVSGITSGVQTGQGLIGAPLRWIGGYSSIGTLETMSEMHSELNSHAESWGKISTAIRLIQEDLSKIGNQSGIERATSMDKVMDNLSTLYQMFPGMRGLVNRYSTPEEIQALLASPELSVNALAGSSGVGSFLSAGSNPKEIRKAVRENAKEVEGLVRDLSKARLAIVDAMNPSSTVGIKEFRKLTEDAGALQTKLGRSLNQKGGLAEIVVSGMLKEVFGGEGSPEDIKKFVKEYGGDSVQQSMENAVKVLKTYNVDDGLFGDFQSLVKTRIANITRGSGVSEGVLPRSRDEIFEKMQKESASLKKSSAEQGADTNVGESIQKSLSFINQINQYIDENISELNKGGIEITRDLLKNDAVKSIELVGESIHDQYKVGFQLLSKEERKLRDSDAGKRFDELLKGATVSAIVKDTMSSDDKKSAKSKALSATAKNLEEILLEGSDAANEELKKAIQALINNKATQLKEQAKLIDAGLNNAKAQEGRSRLMFALQKVLTGLPSAEDKGEFLEDLSNALRVGTSEAIDSLFSDSNLKSLVENSNSEYWEQVALLVSSGDVTNLLKSRDVVAETIRAVNQEKIDNTFEILEEERVRILDEIQSKLKGLSGQLDSLPNEGVMDTIARLTELSYGDVESKVTRLGQTSQGKSGRGSLDSFVQRLAGRLQRLAKNEVSVNQKIESQRENIYRLSLKGTQASAREYENSIRQLESLFQEKYGTNWADSINVIEQGSLATANMYLHVTRLKDGLLSATAYMGNFGKSIRSSVSEFEKFVSLFQRYSSFLASSKGGEYLGRFQNYLAGGGGKLGGFLDKMSMRASGFTYADSLGTPYEGGGRLFESNILNNIVDYGSEGKGVGSLGPSIGQLAQRIPLKGKIGKRVSSWMSENLLKKGADGQAVGISWLGAAQIAAPVYGIFKIGQTLRNNHKAWLERTRKIAKMTEEALERQTEILINQARVIGNQMGQAIASGTYLDPNKMIKQFMSSQFQSAMSEVFSMVLAEPVQNAKLAMQGAVMGLAGPAGVERLTKQIFDNPDAYGVLPNQVENLRKQANANLFLNPRHATLEEEENFLLGIARLFPGLDPVADSKLLRNALGLPGTPGRGFDEKEIRTLISRSIARRGGVGAVRGLEEGVQEALRLQPELEALARSFGLDMSTASGTGQYGVPTATFSAVTEPQANQMLVMMTRQVNYLARIATNTDFLPQMALTQNVATSPFSAPTGTGVVQEAVDALTNLLNGGQMARQQ